MEDLYVGYMKKAMAPDEFLEAIEVPLPSPSLRFRTYKLSKRFDSDISAVCAAFAIELDGERITRSRVAYGGVAATPKRAGATERALAGAVWNEATARAAMDALAADYTPLTDMRASADYRLRTARNLLYRFFLETRPDRTAAGGRGQRVRGGVAARESRMNRQAEGFMARHEALPAAGASSPARVGAPARRGRGASTSTTSRRSPARFTRRSACRRRRMPGSGRSTSPRCARRRGSSRC